MDENDLQHLPCEGDQKSVLKFKRCEPKKFKNISHTTEAFGVLQSLRKDEMFCDIKLVTDDGTVIHGHKAVLVSASPYFRAMFTSFKESNKDHINMKELDSTVLQLLINYIYTGEIIVDEEHVQGLLAAANLIQLDYVKAACVEFLQTQLNPSNCFEIRALADLHNCTEMMPSTDAFIKEQFLEVVKYDGFLSLSLEEVIQLISYSDLAAPSEEYVFESVKDWVKHQLDSRKQFLHLLMEHVRLPLTSKQYLLKNISEEPLLKNNPKCYFYLLEATHFQLLKTEEIITIPKTIRCKPRCLQKVILLSDCHRTYWYDPENNLCNNTPEIEMGFVPSHLVFIADRYVIAFGIIQSTTVGGISENCIQMLDLFSRESSWVPMVNMLTNQRNNFGVALHSNCIYAVGGYSIGNNYLVYNSLNIAEVFDVEIHKWKMVSSLSNKRSNVGVGVLKNFLYAVGGYDSSIRENLNSVECYNLSLKTWEKIAPMTEHRSNPGIGVLDGVVYAVGGININGELLKSVEAYIPSAGEWTSVADMPFENYSNVVVVLDDLLYVFGRSKDVMRVQIYDPKTNTWKLKETCLNGTNKITAAVVIDRPLHFITQ